MAAQPYQPQPNPKESALEDEKPYAYTGGKFRVCCCVPIRIAILLLGLLLLLLTAFEFIFYFYFVVRKYENYSDTVKLISLVKLCTLLLGQIYFISYFRFDTEASR